MGNFMTLMTPEGDGGFAICRAKYHFAELAKVKLPSAEICPFWFWYEVVGNILPSDKARCINTVDGKKSAPPGMYETVTL